MKIALPCENGDIFAHFGHTGQFELFETDGGRIVRRELVSTEGSGHGALAGLLGRLGADAVICGGIGAGANAALSQLGIKVYGGVSGGTQAAVLALLAGELSFDPDARCSGHDHEQGEAHRCGEHGCGGRCHE